MDYLPRPQDPAIPPIQIEFSDTEKYWDDGTWDEHVNGSYWSQFPKRHGYLENEIWNSSRYSNKAWSHPGFHKWIMTRERQELQNIAIGWLFFGTLAEVTRCSLDITNYLQRDGDGNQILKLTASSMDTLLLRWRLIVSHFNGSTYVRGARVLEPTQAFLVAPSALSLNKDDLQKKVGRQISSDDMLDLEAKLDSDGKSPPFERAHSCLERSKAIIGLICEAIDTKTVYAIATLHEFLATVLTTFAFSGDVANAYSKDERWSLGRWILGADFTHYNRGILRNLGWCPRTTRDYWSRQSRTLAMDYFSTNLKSHQSSEDHSCCSEDICAAYQLDPDQYRVAHTSDCPASTPCLLLDLDSEIASAVLNSDPDSFPLVTISRTDEKDDSVFVEVMNATCEESYVAISHVWSHGLGNPKRNALPRCQLQRIQQLVNDVGAKIGIRQRPVPFWMDTLCCPIHPKESRRSAIMKMNMTYERAALVLVLDENLGSVSKKTISRLESLMQIYRTTWMKRLWTLQEARLANQIWFQFKDTAVNLEDLNTEFALDTSGPLTDLLLRRQFIPSLSAWFLGLRESTHKGSQIINNESQDISDAMHRLLALNNGLGGRSTSWASDEAICISNLLALDLAPILEISTEENDCASRRMAAMWSQWGTVPQSIIFTRAPRLSQKGFRWAHSTFIRTGSSGFPIVDVQSDGVIDAAGEGLRVKVPGFILRSNNVPRLLIDHNIALERETDSRWESEAGTSGLATYRTFLIYNTSSLSTEWYDVQIGNSVTEIKPNLSEDTEYLILFSKEVNLSNIDIRQTPALLVAKRKFENGIIYITSLYHVKIARSEPANDKLFTAALGIQQVLMQQTALRGSVVDGEVRFGTEYNPSDNSQQQSLLRIRMLAQTVLDDPEVKDYMMATILKNRSPKMMQWLHASEEQRNDWDFRVDFGDANIFFEMIVNVWLNLATEAKPLALVPGFQGLCVD